MQLVLWIEWIEFYHFNFIIYFDNFVVQLFKEFKKSILFFVEHLMITNFIHTLRLLLLHL